MTTPYTSDYPRLLRRERGCATGCAGFLLIFFVLPAGFGACFYASEFLRTFGAWEGIAVIACAAYLAFFGYGAIRVLIHVFARPRIALTFVSPLPGPAPKAPAFALAKNWERPDFLACSKRIPALSSFRFRQEVSGDGPRRFDPEAALPTVEALLSEVLANPAEWEDGISLVADLVTMRMGLRTAARLKRPFRFTLEI